MKPWQNSLLFINLLLPIGFKLIAWPIKYFDLLGAHDQFIVWIFILLLLGLNIRAAIKFKENLLFFIVAECLNIAGLLLIGATSFVTALYAALTFLL